MAVVLLFGIPLVPIVVIQILRRFPASAARADMALIYCNAAFLSGLEELLGLFCPLSAPMDIFLEEKLRIGRRVESALEKFAGLFGTELDRGDAIVAARRVAPQQSLRLLDIDIPEDLLPPNDDLPPVLDRLAPARSAMARLGSGQVQLSISTALQAFCICGAGTIVCCLVALVFLGFSASLKVFVVIVAGLIVSVGLSIVSFAAAANAQILLNAAEAASHGVRTGVDRCVRDLTNVADFLDTHSRSPAVGVGNCIGPVFEHGAACHGIMGRQAIFDRETFARGILVYSGDARHDAARFVAEAALSWSASAATGVIALDLTGDLATPFLSLIASRGSARPVHRVGLGSKDTGLNLDALVTGELIENLCSSVLERVKGRDSALLASKAMRSVLTLGPLYQLSRRTKDGNVPLEEDARSLAWAIRSVLNNDVKTAIDRIEYRRGEDRRKVEFAVDLQTSQTLSQLYQERYTPEIAQSMEFLREHWLVPRKQTKDARSALKNYLEDALRPGTSLSRFLVPATAGTAFLESSLKGHAVVIDLPGKSNAFIAGLCCMAAGKLFDSLDSNEGMPLLVLHGVERLQVMGERAASELLRVLAMRRVPRLVVADTVTDLERSLGKGAREFCDAQESKIYFRTTDSRTNAVACTDLSVASGPADMVAAKRDGTPAMQRPGHALWSSLDRVVRAKVISQVDGCADRQDPLEIDAVARSFGARSIPFELRELMPGCALMRWVRCGLRRAAVARISCNFD